MEGKGVAESSAILSYALQPQNANPAGNVHGGVIMKHIDTAAGVVAARHARCNVVTASIDRLDFHNPAFIGNLLILKASAKARKDVRLTEKSREKGCLAFRD